VANPRSLGTLSTQARETVRMTITTLPRAARSRRPAAHDACGESPATLARDAQHAGRRRTSAARRSQRAPPRAPRSLSTAAVSRLLGPRLSRGESPAPLDFLPPSGGCDIAGRPETRESAGRPRSSPTTPRRPAVGLSFCPTLASGRRTPTSRKPVAGWRRPRLAGRGERGANSGRGTVVLDLVEW